MPTTNTKYWKIRNKKERDLSSGKQKREDAKRLKRLKMTKISKATLKQHEATLHTLPRPAQATILVGISELCHIWAVLSRPSAFAASWWTIKGSQTIPLPLWSMTVCWMCDFWNWQKRFIKLLTLWPLASPPISITLIFWTQDVTKAGISQLSFLFFKSLGGCCFRICLIYQVEGGLGPHL